MTRIIQRYFFLSFCSLVADKNEEMNAMLQ